MFKSNSVEFQDKGTRSVPVILGLTGKREWPSACMRYGHAFSLLTLKISGVLQLRNGFTISKLKSPLGLATIRALPVLHRRNNCGENAVFTFKLEPVAKHAMPCYSAAL